MSLAARLRMDTRPEDGVCEVLYIAARPGLHDLMRAGAVRLATMLSFKVSQLLEELVLTKRCPPEPDFSAIPLRRFHGRRHHGCLSPSQQTVCRISY